MPNHVKNVLKFKNLKPDDVNFIVNTISIKIDDPDFPDRNDFAIDFDKIIPEPKTESDCPEDCKVNSKSCVEKYKDRPWFDWYEWHNKYWGTKWNAYDCESDIGDNYVKFIFSTAWSTPTPVIERLKLLGYDFELKFADEDLGSNCGVITYDCESAALVHITPGDTTEFAMNLWEKY